jgi:uncharacterized protein YjbI with pentapeptide repeats
MDYCPVEMADSEPCGRPLYRRTVDTPPEPTCIMHYAGPKLANLFQEEIDALTSGRSKYLRAGVVDFRRFRFPSGVTFRTRTFSEYACFLEAVFADSIEFSGAQFVKDANFSGATFSHVDFTSAVFNGNGVFARTTFSQEATFAGSCFQTRADFRESRFGARVDFSDAELHSPIFAACAFGSKAWFGAAKLFGTADFQTAEFVGAADFFAAKFFGSANFGYTKHHGGSAFVNTVFEDVTFGSAELSVSTNFYRTLFNGHANFGFAKFQDVTFRSAQFREGASFEAAAFSGDVEFHHVSFGSAGHADEAAVANFADARFEKPARVWFTQVNKDVSVGFRARFLNCDVEQIHLEDVRWHRRRGRMVLQDELDVLEGSNDANADAKTADRRSGHELVAISYRQLINNFDRVRSLDLAEDCFCGSMEMKRRDPNESPVSRAVLGAYSLASAYGSNYAQALAVLLCIVAAFGLLYALPFLRLEVAPHQDSALQMASTWLRRCPAGLFHSLEAATFQRDATYAFSWRRGRLATIAEQTLVPIQVALLLLALRRRFRR